MPCKICGNDLFSFGISYKWSVYAEGPYDENSCPECGLFLDKNARYCRRCGSVSKLFSFLNPWYEDLKIMEDTLISL